MSEAESPQEGAPRQPTEEEMAAAIVYRLGRTPVRDILLQTMATMSDGAGIRLGLGPEGDAVKDTQQAKLAIETLRALIGVAEQEIGAAATHPFREPLAQLQMLYARVVEADGGATDTDAEPVQQPDPASRLWTPGSGR
ncbi:MAG: hypothetical protein H6531_09755 [Actinobacteria bacterium]|nr:hypothetical protein [Thermoleophilia bacterium]MCB9012099.1 hypothetical protein [Actinomycetota bacterium]